MGPTPQQAAEAFRRRQEEEQRANIARPPNASRMSGRYVPGALSSTNSVETNPYIRNAKTPLMAENPVAVKAAKPVVTKPADKIATATPQSLTPLKPYTIPELQAAGPGEIVQPKGNRNAQYDGTVTTTGSKAAGFMPNGNPRYETNYSVRGANGGTGEMTITGPSQRKGGGTVSVMDQGNGGTVEGNVAALNRQTEALRSLREAQNPGITTGRSNLEAPSTDPFNGDREKRAQYEALIKGAANETGWGGSKRAEAKMAAAGAMLNAGQEQARLRMGLHDKRMDQVTETDRNEAQRMQTRATAEDAAAQRQQAQNNADRTFALNYDNQRFGQIKDRAKFEYDQEKDLREWGSTLSKEAQDEAMNYYTNSGDGKGKNRTSPADLALLGTQLISNGKVDIKGLDNRNPGLVERINTNKLKRTDYYLLEKIKRATAATDGVFSSPDMAEAVNRVLSGQD